MNLDISKEQMKKLMKGGNIQLQHSAIGTGQHFPNLSKALVKKLMSSHKKGKGMRFAAHPSEMQGIQDHPSEMEGSGLKNQIKAVAKRAGIKKEIVHGLDSKLDKAVEMFDGKGIFGPTFDKGLKKIGIKKPVFKVAREVGKPIADALIDNYADSLVRVHPELAGPILAGKHGLKNYIDTPTTYQKKGGVKKLVRKSLEDTVDELEDTVGNFNITGSGVASSNTMKAMKTKQVKQITPKINPADLTRQFFVGRPMTDLQRSQTSGNQITYITETPNQMGFGDDEYFMCPHCSSKFHVGEVMGGSFRQQGGSFRQTTR